MGKMVGNEVPVANSEFYDNIKQIIEESKKAVVQQVNSCLLYTSQSPRD